MQGAVSGRFDEERAIALRQGLRLRDGGLAACSESRRSMAAVAERLAGRCAATAQRYPESLFRVRQRNRRMQRQRPVLAQPHRIDYWRSLTRQAIDPFIPYRARGAVASERRHFTQGGPVWMDPFPSHIRHK